MNAPTVIIISDENGIQYTGTPGVEVIHIEVGRNGRSVEPAPILSGPALAAARERWPQDEGSLYVAQSDGVDSLDLFEGRGS